MFYGARFLGGNRTCTTGNPNSRTGQFSIACEIEVFNTKKDRDTWIEKENLSKPSGLGGGERITVTKKEARRLKKGESKKEFEELLEFKTSLLRLVAYNG